jgi:hypothetical protein
VGGRIGVQNSGNNEVIQKLSCGLTADLLTASSCFRDRLSAKAGAADAPRVGVGMEHYYFYCVRLKWLSLTHRLKCVAARIELLLAAPARVVDHRPYYWVHPR